MGGSIGSATNDRNAGFDSYFSLPLPGFRLLFLTGIRKRLLCTALFAAVTTSAKLYAAEPTTVEDAVRQKFLLRAPRPEYPFQARRQKFTGSELYELRFDYDTGHLREVHIVKRAGDRVLTMPSPTL